MLVRGSATRDPKLHEAPEGLIDPWLRTVTFFDAERPMVQLHYYATHPMSFYGDARISWDVPGLARQRLEQETGVFQIYFNGCGGNIGMGKYNDGTRAAREQLTDRMFDAMRRSARVAAGGEATETEKLDATVEVRSLKPDEIAWDQADLRFTVRDDGPGVTAEALARLGERTFRTDEARQRDPRGSGLGLSITRALGQRCGWSLAFSALEPRGLEAILAGSTVPPRS